MNQSPFSPGDFVVAYLRDSGHEDQDLSVEQQEAAIRAWCTENNLILTHSYIDAAAPGSSTIGRECFLGMIEYFRRGPVRERGILVWKLNRFARSIDDSQYYKADLRRRGYNVFSLNDPVSNDLNGRFFESAIDWMNARYLEDLKVDIKRGIHHLMDQHKSLGGKPPFGFMRTPVQLEPRRDGRPHIAHRWVPDPDKIDLVRIAFSMRAAGRSLKQINDELHVFRYSTSLKDFFGNRLYIGEMDFGGQVIIDYCDPIVDGETWQVVQRVNNQKREEYMARTNHPRRIASDYLLSGLAVCARCGSPLNGDTATFTKKGTRYSYRYYACINKACDSGRIPKQALENAVISSLVDTALGNDNLIGLHQEFEADATSLTSEQESSQRAYSAHLREIQRQITNIVDVITDQGKAASPALVSKLSDLEVEQAELKSKIDDLEIASQDQKITLEQAQANVERIKEKLSGKDPAQLKRILSGLIDHLVVERVDADRAIHGMVFYYYPVEPVENFTSTSRRPWRDSNPQPTA